MKMTSKDKEKLLELGAFNLQFQEKLREVVEKLCSDYEDCEDKSEPLKDTNIEKESENVYKENLTIRSLRTQLQNQKETIISQQRIMWDLKAEIKEKRDSLEKIRETERVQFQKLSKIREIL